MRTDAITVDRRRYLLAPGESPDDLQHQVLDSVRAGGGIIRFLEVGNREIRIVVSPGVPVTFETVDRPDDNRDDGDLTYPEDPDLFHL